MMLPAFSVKFASRLKSIDSGYIAEKVFGKGNSLSTESIPANTPTCCTEKLCQRIWKRNWKTKLRTKKVLNRKKEVSIWEKKTFMGIGAVT